VVAPVAKSWITVPCGSTLSMNRVPLAQPVKINARVAKRGEEQREVEPETGVQPERGMPPKRNLRPNRLPGAGRSCSTQNNVRIGIVGLGAGWRMPSDA